MYYSFAAGTTDGPGAFDFFQGDSNGNTTNPFVRAVMKFLSPPSDAQKKCQSPKPVLLSGGESHFPYEWLPSVVEIQLIRIASSILIVAVPAEFTTMAGRRLISELQRIFPNDKILINGLSNSYASYVTTPEEYNVQRYEGASTLYGIHTLQAYIEAFVAMAIDVKLGKETIPGNSTNA